MDELRRLRDGSPESALARDFAVRYGDSGSIYHNALLVDCIAERALIYLFLELNLVSAAGLRKIVRELDLDVAYLSRRLADNRRRDVL
jgi:thymidine kinase